MPGVQDQYAHLARFLAQTSTTSNNNMANGLPATPPGEMPHVLTALSGNPLFSALQCDSFGCTTPVAAAAAAVAVL
jgi:hypothetical protein